MHIDQKVVWVCNFQGIRLCFLLDVKLKAEIRDNVFPKREMGDLD